MRNLCNLPQYAQTPSSGCRLNQKYFNHGRHKNNALNSAMLVAAEDNFPLFRFHSYVVHQSNNVKITLQLESRPSTVDNIPYVAYYNMWHM